MSNALRGARADDDEAVSLPHGFPSHASSPPARLSRYARSLVPRSPPERPPPRGLIASPSRTAARFELPPPLPFSLPFSLFVPLSPTDHGSSPRRFSLPLLLFTSYSRGRFVAHDVPPSPSTFRAETGRLKADARAKPDDPYRVPRRTMRRNARDSSSFSWPDGVTNVNPARDSPFAFMCRSISAIR